VLVTEDEPVIRAFARIVIEEAGHHVLEAASLEEALELVRSDQPLDLLFTDINLRSLDRGGVDLASEAVKLRPNLRVIYTTGKGLTDEMRAIFVDGGVFIPKPYSPQKLREAMANLLTR
jgi:CheY-like chemotaxis protein